MLPQFLIQDLGWYLYSDFRPSLRLKPTSAVDNRLSVSLALNISHFQFCPFFALAQFIFSLLGAAKADHCQALKSQALHPLFARFRHASLLVGAAQKRTPAVKLSNPFPVWYSSCFLFLSLHLGFWFVRFVRLPIILSRFFLEVGIV